MRISHSMTTCDRTLLDERQRGAIRVAAERIPGSRPSKITLCGSTPTDCYETGQKITVTRCKT
ncbi:MAG: hypothetical protein ACXWC3_22115 [Burkholderiales bacterium]